MSLRGRVLVAAARKIEPGARVFVIGPSLAESVTWAAQAGAEIVAWTENLAEAQACQASLSGLDERCELKVQADFDGLTPESCDMALVQIPRGTQFRAELLQAAVAMVRPGGRIIFAGAKNEGVRVAVKQLRELCGAAGIVARKGGFHAGEARRPATDIPLPSLQFTAYEVLVDEHPTQLWSCSGVFAPDRLDGGAEALIAGMRIAPGEQVLDLGCGTGLVGLAALRRGAQVTLADVSARAVASARRTVAANGFPETPVLLSNLAGAIPSQKFDVVVTNPPFHQGHERAFDTARDFIRDAARVLKLESRVYLVANSFLRYEPWLRQHFSRVRVVWQNRRFKVWEGVYDSAK